ncbi:carbohydrate-binding module family 13 protein [Phycomyces blakesleeanus]|uniref:Carbohydrate-binding module family 13 protein n=1 Tax=Phycomyces blakesleeanus TaxID=4837 RepID=A0ABR3BE31_PHYBL
MSLSPPVNKFPSGFFFIRCKAQPMAVDVNGGSMTLWMHEDGFIINKKSGLVLDIRGGELKKDKLVIQYSRKPGLAQNQRWSYDDGFIFPTAAPHLVLDIKGGDYKETSGIYLNEKDTTIPTQRWLIEPFETPKSKEELALLRPSPLLHTNSFPRPEELFGFYRSFYREHRTDMTMEQIAGAIAFKAIKDYVELQKQNNESITNDDARQALNKLVAEEIVSNAEAVDNKRKLLQIAEQAAVNYYVREYDVC